VLVFAKFESPVLLVGDTRGMRLLWAETQTVTRGLHAYVTEGQVFAFAGIGVLFALIALLGLAFSWHFYSGLFDLLRAAFKRLRSTRKPGPDAKDDLI
jgi:hypothetical protein